MERHSRDNLKDSLVANLFEVRSLFSIRNPLALLTALILVALSLSTSPKAEGQTRALEIQGVHRFPVIQSGKDAPVVGYRCFCPELPTPESSPLRLNREYPWALPGAPLAGAGQQATMNILVLRVDFQLESPDNPRTTGVGKMDFRSFVEFEAQYGHEIDPTPHDSAFYNKHMESLALYYGFVSRGSLQLSWDIWPRGDLSKSGDTLTYLLPREMAYYGDTVLIEERLTEFFRDCLTTADAISPEINFGDYESIIIFHAGSDRQNDIGFPATPNDLFTGFLKTTDTVWLDNDSTAITNGLFLPEMSNQDNRATALNAVLAHEFGHQLGLVDLYSTRTGFTQIGDFALMDNNGFGVGIDFGFQSVFQTFGAFPIYMSAWSRAFLGFDKVREFPIGTPLWLAAAAISFRPDTLPQIAKIPISRYEYFLLENRQQVIDTFGGDPFVAADAATGVIIGPARDLFLRTPSGEYDFLLPGNGILIYHVDESVAFGDADGDGQPNWQDNDMQWDPKHRFISLVEADGFIDLGGNFFKGFGNAADYWTPDGFNSFTPNTNPATGSVTGAQTHLSISIDTSTNFNHNIAISYTNDRARANFPIWGGIPSADLHPIAAEVDSFPGEEIIFASGTDVIVSAADGTPGWRFPTTVFKGLINFVDTLEFFIGEDSSVTPTLKTYSKNLFARLPNEISAGPIFGTLSGQSVIAVVALDTVYVFGLFDSNPFDPRPDSLWKLTTDSPVREIMFNDWLYAMTDSSVNQFTGVTDIGTELAIPGVPLGWAAVSDQSLVVFSSDGNSDKLSYVEGTTINTHILSGFFDFGPWATDFDRDGTVEVGVISRNGSALIFSIVTTTATPTFELFSSSELGREITGPPALGDVDRDGYPDMLFPGAGIVIGVNHELSALDNFPQTIDREYSGAMSFNPPIIADLDRNGTVDIALGAEVDGILSGNIYALGADRTFGFPLPAGGAPRGSALLIRDSIGATLGYLGVDGFFYCWNMGADTALAFWRMGAGDAAGRNYFFSDVLPSPAPQAGGIKESSFFCYPNPATGQNTTLRYKLGRTANSVSLTMFDLTGKIVNSFSGGVGGGLANEISVDCSQLTPGVYRIRLEAEFSDGSETAFTDVAIVH